MTAADTDSLSPFPTHLRSLSSALRRGLPAVRFLVAAVLVIGGCKKDSPVDPFLPDGDRLVFVTEPTTTVAGVSIFPSVRVAIVDTGGNVVARNNVDIQLYLDSTDPRDTLLGTTNVSTVAGVSTFTNLGLRRAPTTFRLTAVARGLTGTQSTPFSVSVGPAAKLAFTVQPTNVVAGEIMLPKPTVVIQDALGNFVSNDSGLVVLQVFTGPSGTVPRNNAVTAIGGTAVFDSLRIKTASTLYTLSAVGPSGRGLTAAVSSIFNVVAGAPRLLYFTVQPPPSTVKNLAFTPPMKVTVADSMNNTALTFTGTVSLEWDFNPDSAIVNGSSSVAAVGGVATFGGISVDRPSTTSFRLRAVAPAVPDTARSNFFQVFP